jgi:hypothetical protein
MWYYSLTHVLALFVQGGCGRLREAAVAARGLDDEPELLVAPEQDPAVACACLHVGVSERIKGAAAVAAEPESSRC